MGAALATPVEDIRASFAAPLDHAFDVAWNDAERAADEEQARDAFADPIAFFEQLELRARARV